ncbi:MAG: hypothetical protein ACJAVO_002222, partial [Parvibaculaceae bacterium]
MRLTDCTSVTNPDQSGDILAEHSEDQMSRFESFEPQHVQKNVELSQTNEIDGLSDEDLNSDRLREECGVFGMFNHPDASALTALGLHALQHRGQEAAGIVSFDGTRFQSERRMG